MQDNSIFDLQQDEIFTPDYQGTEERGRSRLQVLRFSSAGSTVFFVLEKNFELDLWASLRAQGNLAASNNNSNNINNTINIWKVDQYVKLFFHEENRKVSGEFYRVASYFVYFRKEIGVFFLLFCPGFCKYRICFAKTFIDVIALIYRLQEPI